MSRRGPSLISKLLMNNFQLQNSIHRKQMLLIIISFKSKRMFAFQAKCEFKRKKKKKSGK